MTYHEMSWGEPAWPADDPGPPEPPLDAQPPINNHHPDTPVLADKVLTRSALRNLPKPEPLIDDTLDRATFALLYGAKSAYKTFVVLDWGLSAATHTSLDVRHGLGSYLKPALCSNSITSPSVRGKNDHDRLPRVHHHH